MVVLCIHLSIDTWVIQVEHIQDQPATQALTDHHLLVSAIWLLQHNKRTGVVASVLNYLTVCVNHSM